MKPNITETLPTPYLTGKIVIPNQTCGTCKHWDKEAYKPECVNPEVSTMALDGWDYPARLCPTYDFGCNRWEAK